MKFVLKSLGVLIFATITTACNSNHSVKQDINIETANHQEKMASLTYPLPVANDTDNILFVKAAAQSQAEIKTCHYDLNKNAILQDHVNKTKELLIGSKLYDLSSADWDTIINMESDAQIKEFKKEICTSDKKSLSELKEYSAFLEELKKDNMR